MEMCENVTQLEKDDDSSETEFCNFAMNEFDEKENLFRD
jgi:hypothetical protein